MNDAVQIVSSVGFPIFMCLLLVKVIKENETVNAKIIDNLRGTIDKNTIILTKIYEQLGVDKNAK